MKIIEKMSFELVNMIVRTILVDHKVKLVI